ncbi:MAG: carbohydrate binding family 9 domain-containing protein [Gemmatimonadetes bacterium]|nr:carbohydrate binding family 9 domain-containing protein [Gemmatimonadota bacterium]
MSDPEQRRRADRLGSILMRSVVCGVAATALLVPGPVLGQGGIPGGDDALPPLDIPRLSGPIEIDGIVDDAAWDAIDPLPMTQYEPVFGSDPSERTEVRIGHDDAFLYVSGRMYDSEPDLIRTNTFYRDLYSGDDLLSVLIDSYNDYQTAVWFVTNPAGARNDRTVSNDAVFSGGMPMNSDWNAHWDVVTTQTDEGWFAEFRIPFSTLGFQSRDGEVTMGLILYRFIPRRNERITFPAIEPIWGGLGFAKPSVARRIVLRDVRQSKPIYVTPYTLGGLQQTPVQDEVAGVPIGWHSDSDPTGEVGVDLRYSPTSNLAVDLTVNTDFAQVEADDQQINLTRFPLFFPEKRQFFQERASTFQFNTGGFSNRLFHSRRIGLDAGEIVRIYGGARAVGRIGGMDFGFIDMQTADHAGRSSENMGVLRLRQEVLNPSSAIGAMVTSRLGSSGQDNVALGLDAVLRPVGDEFLTVKWARTFDEQVDEASTAEASLFQARWQRVRDAGISYHAEFIRVGDDFLPRLGFQPRRDFRFYGGSTQYRKLTDAASPLQNWAARLEASQYTRASDGRADSRSIESRFSLEFKGGTEVWFTGASSYESVLNAFPVAGAEVPAGDYWFHEGRLRIQLPRADLLRGSLNASVGSFYDGNRVGLGIEPAWNQSKYLELSAGYEWNRLAFPDRNVYAHAHLGRLKAQLALDTKISFSGLMQYSNVADLTTFNARFRYHIREGTDLWVVYNEGLNTRRDLADQPRLPLSAGRTVMIKYTHAFIW